MPIVNYMIYSKQTCIQVMNMKHSIIWTNWIWGVDDGEVEDIRNLFYSCLISVFNKIYRYGKDMENPVVSFISRSLGWYESTYGWKWVLLKK